MLDLSNAMCRNPPDNRPQLRILQDAGQSVLAQPGRFLFRRNEYHRHMTPLHSAMATVSRTATVLLTAMASAFSAATAQNAAPLDRPLPDVAELMHTVENRQRAAETIEKNYIFHSIVTGQQVDSHGAVKKTEVTEYDDFWLGGVPVRKLVRKDGRDLSADEQNKESERIDKEVAKARERREKEDAKGKETDPRGHDEVTVSRLLELGSFTNPRRIQLNGRDTIVVDYTGDPSAKTRNSSENVIRDMAGTVWIDEQDRAIAQLQGHFVNGFKIGGGLLVSIQKGTSFSLEQKRVNGEVWLPAHIEGHGEARAFLFFRFNGSLTIVDSDYRRFKTTSTVLPVSER